MILGYDWVNLWMGICNYCFLFCMFLIYNIILIGINIYMNLKYEGKKCKKKKK